MVMPMYKYGVYKQKKRRLINLAGSLERAHDLVWNMNDDELNLFNTQGGFYRNGPIPIEILNNAHPRLASDSAFQKLKFFYDALRRRGLREGGSITIRREPFSTYTLDGLNSLATDIANRKMDEYTYKAILEERINCIYEAKRMIEEIPIV